MNYLKACAFLPLYETNSSLCCYLIDILYLAFVVIYYKNKVIWLWVSFWSPQMSWRSIQIMGLKWWKIGLFSPDFYKKYSG
jgi:hypothetical protein